MLILSGARVFHVEVALVVLLVILCIQCIVLVSARRRMGNLGDIERKDSAAYCRLHGP